MVSVITLPNRSTCLYRPNNGIYFWCSEKGLRILKSPENLKIMNLLQFFSGEECNLSGTEEWIKPLTKWLLDNGMLSVEEVKHEEKPFETFQFSTNHNMFLPYLILVSREFGEDLGWAIHHSDIPANVRYIDEFSSEESSAQRVLVISQMNELYKNRSSFSKISHHADIFISVELWPRFVNIISLPARQVSSLPHYEYCLALQTDQPDVELDWRRGKDSLRLCRFVDEDYIKTLIRLLSHYTSHCGRSLSSVSMKRFHTGDLNESEVVSDDFRAACDDEYHAFQNIFSNTDKKNSTNTQRTLSILNRICDDLSNPAIVGYQQIFTDSRLSVSGQLQFVKSKCGYPLTVDPGKSIRGVERGTLGVDQDLSLAKIKAMGEAIERYATMQNQSGKDLLARQSEIPEDLLLPPGLFCLGTKADTASQVAQDWDDDHKYFQWLPAYNLRTHDVKLIHSDLVHYLHQDRQPVVEDSSNGAACHTNFFAAIINGIEELFERDAILCHWLLKIKPPQIRLNGLCEQSGSVLSELYKMGYEIKALDITLDSIFPTVLLLGIRKELAFPYMAIAAGCSAHLKSSVQSAIKELAATLIASNMSDYESYTSKNKKLFGHRNKYLNPQNRHIWQFLVNGPMTESDLEHKNNPASDYSDRLSDIIRYCNKKEFTPLIVNTTPEQLSKYPVHTIKALIPELQPLYFGSNMARMNLKRLKHVSHDKYGTFKEADINRDLHPLS
ncbi:MAG: YcaO-like family protein [Deltaproteobacteria bacterium]|nr:YcaO-like family protein [Deltaproteobacteria bacterium]